MTKRGIRRRRHFRFGVNEAAGTMGCKRQLWGTDLFWDGSRLCPTGHFKNLVSPDPSIGELRHFGASKIRRTTFLNYIRLTDFLILGL